MVLVESRDSGRREPSPGTRPASVCPVAKPGLSIWLLLFQGPVALLVVSTPWFPRSQTLPLGDLSGLFLPLPQPGK